MQRTRTHLQHDELAIPRGSLERGKVRLLHVVHAGDKSAVQVIELK